MNEGVVSGRLGPGRLAGRRPRRRSSPATCCSPAHVGSRLHVCHVSTAGSVEILRWAKAQGLPGHRRGDAAPPAAHRRAGRHVRPGLQGQPAAADRRGRRGAAGRRWPTAPSTRSPPTTRRTRSRTRRPSGPRPRPGCSAWRPRCRWWCRRCVETGLLDWARAWPTGCRPRRRGSAGSPATAGRSRWARRPTLTLVDPAARWTSDPAALASRSRNTPYAGRELPARVVATFLRGGPTVLDGNCRASRRAGGPADARARACWCSRTDGRSAARRSARSGRAFGEAVFATGMTGYQETLTDPSYHRQVVVRPRRTSATPAMQRRGRESRPDLGRRLRRARPGAGRRATGASPRACDDELAAHGVVGISGVDTRALTRHLRERGAMRVGRVQRPSADPDELLRAGAGEPVDARRRPGRRGHDRGAVRRAGGRAAATGSRPSTWASRRRRPRCWPQRGIEVHVLPAPATAGDAARRRPGRGVPVATGPGDPADRRLRGRR